MKILQSLIKDPDSWKFLWECNQPITAYYNLKDVDDDTLLFESRFESGNLDMAIKIDDSHYKLVMQNDSNTRGNTQWFYFRVQNTRKNRKFHFEIINFVKQ